MAVVTTADLGHLVADRHEFVSRLHVENKKGRLQRMNDPTPGQVEWFNIIGDMSYKEIVAFKPRQVRYSQTNCADVWHRTYSATGPFRTIVATNHGDTTRSLFRKFQVFWKGMPLSLKRRNPFKLNLNEHTITSSVTGAMIDHLTAGGTSHGRSWTYQLMVAEELAFWKNAEDVWAALTNTLDEGCPIRIISTADGPGNLYHQKVKSAQRAMRNGDETVRFIFSRWPDFPEYSKTPPDGWEPDQEEYELAQTHGLTIEQLYWRHNKVHGVRGIGERRFRHEFPLTVEDGFLVLEGAWFDVDFLNAILASLPDPIDRPVRIYHPPEMGKLYVAGIDPSWCSGGNNAVCQILDRDGRQCATLSMNTGGEDQFARHSSELIHAYNKAKTLCEANKGGAGQNVIKILRQEGVPLWTDENGKLWTTGHGNKENAYGHCRQMVNGDVFELNDHATIEELMEIHEDDGKIEGKSGAPDDHADAFVLAEWNRQSLPGAPKRPREMRRRYTRKVMQPMNAIRRAMR